MVKESMARMRRAVDISLLPTKIRTDHCQSARRQFLIAAAATLAATALGGSNAVAEKPKVRTFRHGEFSIAVISDGHLTVPTRFLARNASEPDIRASIGAASNLVTPPCNITLVRTPTETILIDVGAGPHFMTGAGKLAENMDTAGIDRGSITKVVLTHAHPDHLWGLLDDFDDTPLFPNASYVLSTAEFEFWMAEDAASRLPADRQNFALGAKRNLSRIKERLQLIAPGAYIVSGIRTIDTSGHTAGHISLEIAAGNEMVVVLADALTHPVISFAHPEWSPVADHHDPDRAVATRRNLLARLASDRSLAIGFHLPFPGLGRVEQDGSAFRYVPET